MPRYLVTSSFKLISSKWLSYAYQRLSEKRWDKVRYMRSPCNDIYFYTVINWNSVYIMHGRGLPRFWKVYIHIYWIFCDLVSLRYQTWFISSWPRLSWVRWECSYIVNYYIYYFGGLVAHPCFLLSSHNNR